MVATFGPVWQRSYSLTVNLGCLRSGMIKPRRYKMGRSTGVESFCAIRPSRDSLIHIGWTETSYSIYSHDEMMVLLAHVTLT